MLYTPGFAMIALTFILCLSTYLVAGIPFGVIVGHFYSGTDIREVGSGNIGSTNAMRAGGPKAGVVTLLFDSLKGLVPVVLARAILQLTVFADNPALIQPGGSLDFLIALVAASALCGHIFSPYLHFKGGKGIATGLGVCIGWHPAFGFSLLIPFLIGVGLTKYVSVGSIMAALSMPILLSLFDPATTLATKLLFTAMGLLCVWAHRSNIKKLRNGTESKLSFGPKTK